MEQIPFLKDREEIIEVFKKLQDISEPFDRKKLTFHEDDSSVSYDGNVLFQYNNLIQLPFQFRYVSGNFYIYRNELYALIGCPAVVGGSFWCSENNITTLDGGPRIVGGDYHCYDNPLETLSGFPDTYQEISIYPKKLTNDQLDWLREHAELVEKWTRGHLKYKPKNT